MGTKKKTRLMSNACKLLVACILMASAHAAQSQSDTVAPAQARIRDLGNINQDGVFSFWTQGVLGDWFMGQENGTATLTVVASGLTQENEAPRLQVERLSADGEVTPVGDLKITSGKLTAFHLPIPLQEAYFGIRLRHANRLVGQTDEQGLRHLLVKAITVKGARRADGGPNEYALFGTAPDASPAPKSHTVETAHLRVQINPQTGVWAAAHKDMDSRLEHVRPVLRVRGLPPKLSTYTSDLKERRIPDHPFGPMRALRLRYEQPDALTIIYSLLISETGNDIVARVDIKNRTERSWIIHRVAPVAAQRVTLGGQVAQWRALGDGKRYCDPHQLVDIETLDAFNPWWHLAVRNQVTRHTVLLGALTNNKGIGRFVLVPQDSTSVRAAAFCDYENIVMPAGAQIRGEPMLLHFGRRGNDSLERFGELVALANHIDLDGGLPLDPYCPESVAAYNYFNSYGAGVVRGFAYKHDRSQGEQAFMDRQWTQANHRMMDSLGLRDFGYSPRTTRRTRGAPSPLARRYGYPDFWFTEAREISERHPEFYIGKRVDFSNPQVTEFEQQRVARAFSDKQAIIRYGWDFTDLWQKLPGQHDPFMTSAETYRLALGIWREAARAHPGGSRSNVCMSIVGFNYDRVDSLRIGADSDQGYYGRVCTFTQGLTRQASGRYFYNGKVWWNNADSFHVYVGGLYSYRQAKTHASFCALAGNVMMVGEPFTDETIPEDRLDIIRRVAPSTRDVGKAVDVFDHNPARLWNMPIERSFGKWNVVGLFNVDYGQKGIPLTQRIDLTDLELSADKTYLVYAFWNRRFLGEVKGSFTRSLQAPDCEVYAIVEKTDHPILISTSRHVRQMAYDIIDLAWDNETQTLRGLSKLVRHDPYELRVYVPEGHVIKTVKVKDTDPTLSQKDRLLTVAFTSSTNRDVPWSLDFKSM